MNQIINYYLLSDMLHIQTNNKFEGHIISDTNDMKLVYNIIIYCPIPVCSYLTLDSELWTNSWIKNLGSELIIKDQIYICWGRKHMESDPARPGHLRGKIYNL